MSISLLQSFKDWWATPSTLMKPTSLSKEFETARYNNLMIEYELYRAILSDDIIINKPYENKSYDSGFIGSFVDTELDDGAFIHEFLLENKNGPPSDSIVIVHGYMAASGYFVKNFETLVKSKPGIKIHIIDLPGFGNSSRPKFPANFLKEYDDKHDQIQQILKIENWFIDKFEEWRIKNALTDFKLIGHSMGGYLMSCYLMKYNLHQVKQFMVVSPMGTEPSDVSLINDKYLQVNHHELVSSENQGSDPLRELIMQQTEDGMDDNELEHIWEKLGRPNFPKNIILRKLWEYKISPFQLLQLFGPFFSKLLSLWSFQRFRNLKANDDTKGSNSDLILKLHYYSYSIFNQFQGSGELAITKLITHEILPRLPLGDRYLAEFLAQNQISSFWLYGDKDWMNRNGGEAIHNKILELGGLSRYEIVEKAGHHIYLDNPAEFNRLVIDFFNDEPSSQAKV